MRPRACGFAASLPPKGGATCLDAARRKAA